MMKNVMKAWLKLSVKIYLALWIFDYSLCFADRCRVAFLDWFINDVVGGKYIASYWSVYMDLETVILWGLFALEFAAVIMILKFVYKKGKEIFNKVKEKIKERIIEEEVVEAE